MAVIYVGRRIYYLKETGMILKDTGTRKGWIEVPKDGWEAFDFEVYPVLSEYKREAIGVLTLQYGEFDTEFNECTSYRVNPSTQKLEFDYTEIPPSPDVPRSLTLNERMDNLEATQAEQDAIILDNAYRIEMQELNSTI